MRGDEPSVRLLGGFFVVTVPDPRDRHAVRRLLESWYRRHALAIVRERASRVLASTTWLDVGLPPIGVRTLQKRWGSATRGGRLTFNIDLVKLPLPCIDYVVAHELVHLVVPNHGPAFWRTLGRVMPDWKRWRERVAVAEI